MISSDVKKSTPDSIEADVLVLPVYQDGTFPALTKEVDKKVNGLIVQEMKQSHFEAEKGKGLLISIPSLKSKKVFLIGLGKKNEIKRNTLREAYGSAAIELGSSKYESVAVPLPEEKTFTQDWDAAMEGFLLGTYRFNKYKEKPERPLTLKEVYFTASNAQGVTKITTAKSRAQILAEATCLARDLINEPANVVNPSFLEAKATEVAKEAGLKINVLKEEVLKKNGMNLILAVGMGSEQRPRMVHLEYKPKGGSGKTIALVGKGVCFDSGGLSLKSQDNMYGMKADMSGATAVLAAMWAISKLNLNVHVHGLMPLVENMPSGSSVRPGDVFVSLKGKSVEIENTDAEGRLILADALTYAGKLGATEIVDAATLTGACVVALGEDIAGMFSNNSGLVKKIYAAGEKAGEKFWEMPMEKAYFRMLKSNVADFKNVGARWGGSITAALFLQEFVPEKAAWAHLDIAGPAYVDFDTPISVKGGTGFVVRTMVEWAASFPKSKGKSNDKSEE